MALGNVLSILRPADEVGRRSFVRMILVRLLGVAALLAVISFLVYCLLYFAPGDIVQNLIGTRSATAELEKELAAQYGLDKPLIAQYLNWLGNVFSGELGTSIQNQVDVVEVLRQKSTPTLLMAGMAFLMMLVTAVPLGVVSALGAGSKRDTLISGGVLVLWSTPSFVLGLVFMYFFAYFVPIFPIYGTGEGLLDSLYHLFLPALTLALGLSAIVVKLTRTALLDELHSDYVMFLHARGLSAGKVTRIALRNAAVPIVTSVGLVLVYLVTGTILVETTFSIPGIGMLLQSSIQFKDYPVVQSLVLLIALIIAMTMLAVDVICAALDPRLRGKGAR